MIWQNQEMMTRGELNMTGEESETIHKLQEKVEELRSKVNHEES